MVNKRTGLIVIVLILLGFFLYVSFTEAGQDIIDFNGEEITCETTVNIDWLTTSDIEDVDCRATGDSCTFTGLFSLNPFIGETEIQYSAEGIIYDTNKVSESFIGDRTFTDTFCVPKGTDEIKIQLVDPDGQVDDSREVSV